MTLDDYNCLKTAKSGFNGYHGRFCDIRHFKCRIYIDLLITQCSHRNRNGQTALLIMNIDNRRYIELLMS